MTCVEIPFPSVVHVMFYDYHVKLNIQIEQKCMHLLNNTCNKKCHHCVINCFTFWYNRRYGVPLIPSVLVHAAIFSFSFGICMLTWYTCVFLIDPVLYRSSIYHSGVCTSRKFVELFTKVSPKQYSVPRLRHDGVHYIHHLQFYAAPSKGSHYICSPDSPWHGACSLVRGKSKARYIQDKRLHSLTIKLTTCSKLNTSILSRPPSISMFRFRFLFTINLKL